jgi:hypothetical protein
MKNFILSVGLGGIGHGGSGGDEIAANACEFNGLFGEHGAKHQLGPMSELDF